MTTTQNPIVPPPASASPRPSVPPLLLDALRPLTKQGLYVVGFRAAKRVEVGSELRNVAVMAAAAGFGVPNWAWYGREAATVVGDIAYSQESFDATNNALNTAAFCAFQMAYNCELASHYYGVDKEDERRDAADDAGQQIFRYALADAEKVKTIEEQQTGNGIRLTGWDDPRLGPLWPEGAPEWHQKAERLLRELQEKLANRPDPFAPPISEATLAQRADLRKIDELAAQGVFQTNNIRREYVVVYNGRLVCHGPDLAQVRQDAVKNHGVPLARFVSRYIY